MRGDRVGGALRAHRPRPRGRDRAGPAPALDPERHYLDGSREDVAAYLLTLDAINFGSGWFPTLRKRPGCSGYYTIAWALADRFRAHGPWSSADLRELEAAEVAAVLGQDPTHELMALYAQALRDLGAWLGDRTPSTRWARPAPPRSGWPSSWPPGCRSSTTAASGSARRSCPTT